MPERRIMIPDTERGLLGPVDRLEEAGDAPGDPAMDMLAVGNPSVRDAGAGRGTGGVGAPTSGAGLRETPVRIVLRGWQHPTVSADRPGAPSPAQPALAAHVRGRSTRPGWTAWLPDPARTLPELAANELAASGQDPSDGLDAAAGGERRASAPFFEADHYLAGFADPSAAPARAEALAHFLRHGWREGRSPGLSFDTRFYLAAHPDVAREGINPLWHYVLAGRAEGRLPVDPLRPPFGSMLERAPAELARIAPLVDRTHYLATYPDVLASGDDPLLHYCRYGWREGRNPSRSFHTRYYLETNPEVAARDINPLWHYAVLGQREGRHPVDRTGFQRTLLGALRTADERTRDYEASDSLSVLDPAAILALLRRSLAEAGGPGPASAFVLSLSHDPYRRVVGGTQIFIADEEARFRAAGGAYLHVSPVVPRLRLANDADGPLFLRLTLDGAEIGHLDAVGLAAALRALAPELPPRRLLVLHCLLGHATADVAVLHDALRPESTVLWLHDYSTLCEGFNLLRNDATFCGAPPPGSQACRVCIHGPARAGHLAQMQALFAAVSPDIVAPSRAALRAWQDGRASLRTPPVGQQAPDLPVADAVVLPVRSTRVHPHARIEFTAIRRSLVAPERRGTPAHPVRVAFVGHPGAHKGWPAFLDMAGECGEGGAYRFYHFSDAPAPRAPAWIRHVAVQVAPDQRDATREALEAHAIDLVVMPAPWPETFSYVAYEAIASGADILTLADSGNVAAEVLRSGRGLVLDDASACTDFLVSGRAVEYVRLCIAQGSQVGRLVHCGTTATLAPAAEPPPGSVPEPAAGHALAGAGLP
ncbi:MAG: hypothetical protein ACRYG6_15595 [Janthinobacterium lividum]